MSNHLTKKDFDKISRALSAPGASITKVTAKYPHGKRTISRVSSVKNCGTPGMTGFKGYKMRLAQESHDRRRKIIKEAYELADRSSGGSQNVSPAELHRQDVLRTLHDSE